jgi:hypothetical protein
VSDVECRRWSRLERRDSAPLGGVRAELALRRGVRDDFIVDEDILLRSSSRSSSCAPPSGRSRLDSAVPARRPKIEPHRRPLDVGGRYDKVKTTRRMKWRVIRQQNEGEGRGKESRRHSNEEESAHNSLNPNSHYDGKMSPSSYFEHTSKSRVLLYR